MNRLRSIILLFVSLLVCHGVPLQATCWCGIVYCVGIWDAPLIIDTSKTRTEIEINTLAESGILRNGSCTIPGNEAPKKTCSVNGEYGETKRWEVSGSLHYSFLGLQGIRAKK
jgi:hypothetical protein